MFMQARNHSIVTSRLGIETDNGRADHGEVNHGAVEVDGHAEQVEPLNPDPAGVRGSRRRTLGLASFIRGATERVSSTNPTIKTIRPARKTAHWQAHHSWTPGQSFK